MAYNSSINKKHGQITRSDRTSSAQQVNVMLDDLKKKSGEVILVAITNRTTIELPAHLTQTEIDARVANYLKLHNSKV